MIGLLPKLWVRFMPKSSQAVLPAAVALLLCSWTFAQDLPVQHLKAGGDAHKRYFIIGPSVKATAAGQPLGLLVFLPGGEKSGEDWLDTGKGWARQLPSDQYIFAFPVSVRWNEKQTNPWPTAKTPEKGMKFSTEEFLEAVVAEIMKNQKIDSKRVFLFAYQQSATAGYAAGLRPQSPFTAISIGCGGLKSKDLPALGAAARRLWYLVSWPGDRGATPKEMQDARAVLSKTRAMVELKEYTEALFLGGKGCDAIKEMIAWFESKTGSPPPK